MQSNPKFTVDLVSQMFPHTPKSNIQRNLPFVLSALKDDGLDDPQMVLMALATIRAETESFEPISEYKSHYNSSPGGHFDLYDHRRDLGNQGPPDGANFRGRGYIQLTGRYNYEKYGNRIGLGNELIEYPEKANEPEVAAKLLSAFLKDNENSIRAALQTKDLAATRRLVNGGTHGIDRFSDAFNKGKSLIS